MRSKFGTCFMVLGAVLILGALSLFLWNQYEDAQAEAAIAEILPQVTEEIQTVIQDAQQTDPDSTGSAEMTEVEVDGYAYIGTVSIPALGLELPVMSEWDYTRLNIAPCRYYGSVKTDNIVIAAHNYRRHFGSLKNLAVGDEVAFTDMDGVVYCYTVTSIDVLEATDVEEMTSGDSALTLFTCTYGGRTRVTVRCARVE